MARFALLALALLPLACADASEAALYDLRESDAPAVEGAPVIPYGERIRELPPIASEPIEEPEDDEEEDTFEPPAWPTFRGEPRITVGPWQGSRAEDDESFESSAQCPFEVHSRGFPAISSDGSTIIGISRGNWSASDGEDERMVVRWLDVDRDEVVHSANVFDGGDGPFDYDDPNPHCKKMWRAAKQAALDINAKIAEGSWRPLVDVGIHGGDELFEEQIQGEEEPLVPAAERPVELVHVGKQAALRIRGVEVLHRALVDWIGTETWPCMLEPNVLAVLGDRDSGTLAVFLDHQTGGCLCYSEIELHALRVPDEMFAEAAARPNVPRVPELVITSSR